MEVNEVASASSVSDNVDDPSGNENDDKVEKRDDSVNQQEDEKMETNDDDTTPQTATEDMAGLSSKAEISTALPDCESVRDSSNVDVEMEAMFSEEPSGPAVSLKEGQPETSTAVSPSSEQPQNVAPIDEDIDHTVKEELSQTPDESNLEFMMEALHADKVPQSPPQKPSETSGLELKDVLQALTGDLEPDETNKKIPTRSNENESGVTKAKSNENERNEESDESSESHVSERKNISKASSGRELGSDDPSSNKSTIGKKAKSTSKDSQLSESESESESDSKTKTARRTRSTPSTNVLPKSNKVCVLNYCRQQCIPQLGISLHRFPMSPNPMRAYWLKLVKMNAPGPVNTFICSKHFKDEDYNYDNLRDPTDTFYRKLKSRAIPTVNLPVSDEVIEQIKKKVKDIEERPSRSRSSLEVGKTADEGKKTLKKGTTGSSSSKSAKVKEEEAEESDPEESESERGVPTRSLRSHSSGSGSSGKPSDAKEVDNHEKKVAKSKRTVAIVTAASSLPNSPSRSSTSSHQASSKIPLQKKKVEVESKGRTPGTNCSIPSCGNNLFETRAEGLSVSYYRFPFDNSLAEKWMKKIGDMTLNTRTARVCSDHFSDKDFTDVSSGGKRTLKPKAVPTLFLREKKSGSNVGSDKEEDEEGENASFPRKRKGEGKKKAKIGKPDTSLIMMPLPIIEDIEIKSEPLSDHEDIGQEYVAEEPESEDEEYIPLKRVKMEKALPKAKSSLLAHERKSDEENTAPVVVKRPRGRPRKDKSIGKPGAQSKPISQIKTVSLASLSLPVVSLERLGKRVVEAADAGTLRVRIKENQSVGETGKGSQQSNKYKPGPKSKRKRMASDDDSDAVHNDLEEEENNLRYKCKPGPLSKKKKILEQLREKDKPKRKGSSVTTTLSGRRSRKVVKMSDYDTDSEVDDPLPSSPSARRSIKGASPAKVKLAELPKFLQEKGIKVSMLEGDMGSGGDFPCDLESLLASEKSDKEKIIQLVEQRISEHTKIIEGKTMGPQQLADHNKILQGSALVLKRLAEKSGKTLPASQIMPLNVSETAAMPGRTIVLKKVSDPVKLGLKPPNTTRLSSAKSESSSPSRSPGSLNANKSPLNASKDSVEFKEELKASSALEKIREYDSLMKRYLSAVLDKNVMSKKYTEAKEAQKSVETKLQEKSKELEIAKRKIGALQAKTNRINSALESFLTPNQIKLALQETKKVAWSPEEMLTAFTIKHLSKACYLFLRHKLNYPLPGISSLQRWMTMLSKDKAEDDEDNIADEDLSDKEDNQEMLEDGLGVVNEITGTLEEINACGAPGQEHLEGTEIIKDSNQSSPFQVVFENDNSNRKVIILKKVPKDCNKSKLKSKLQISASENDVNVSNIEDSSEKNEIYRLLPGAKTISMSSSPGSPQRGMKFIGSKKIKEKEKISFQRLPQIRKDLLKPKPPRIQIVKSEAKDEGLMSHQSPGSEEQLHLEGETVHINNCIVDDSAVAVKREEISPHDDTQQKFFTLSDLSAVTMDEHVVENVEHLTEEQITHKDPNEGVDQEFLVTDKGMESTIIVKEGVSEHQLHHETGRIVQSGGLEELVNIATAADPQQITFTTGSDDMSQSHHHFTQIAYTSDGNPGEITLHEDINNMTAVVINDIDEEQFNTLLLSNVVEQKGVEIEGDQSYVQKKIVYQAIDQDKNVIVLQPDSQAFIEEDGGLGSTGAPRVYIINDEGHIVSTSSSETAAALAQEIGFIDPDAFVGLKLSSDPDHPSYSIGHLIDNYAIASPTKSFQKPI